VERWKKIQIGQHLTHLCANQHETPCIVNGGT